jgi:hypothetical protein
MADKKMSHSAAGSHFVVGQSGLLLREMHA